MYNKKHVFEQYLEGRCTPEQAAWLVTIFSEEDFRVELERYVDEILKAEQDGDEQIEDLYTLSKAQYPIVEALIFKAEQHKKVYSFKTYWRWVAVAAAVLVFFIGYYQREGIFKSTPDITNLVSKNGKNPKVAKGMTLTLPNGEVVELLEDSETSYASIERKNGVSFFELKKLNEAKEPMIQEVYVPAGKTGSLLMTDGTKVWLNADSKISYDVNFVGAQREVNLEGEAYFEVAVNKHKPFIVNSKDQRVQVLGTHFNVKAYGDSKTVTTLIEGSVQVSTANSERLLKPGQRSDVGIGGGAIRISSAMLYEVNAWRHSEFAFYDADLDEIGRELSRWYGVEVRVVGRPTSFGFTGVISKHRSLEEVLEILNRTGQIRYHIVPVGVKERRVVLMA